jgi:hypothetical protein
LIILIFIDRFIWLQNYNLFSTYSTSHVAKSFVFVANVEF